MSGKESLRLRHLVRRNPDNRSVFLDQADCTYCLEKIRGPGAEHGPGLRIRATPRKEPNRSSSADAGRWILAACMGDTKRLRVLHKPPLPADQRSSYRMRLGKTSHYQLAEPEADAHQDDMSENPTK